MPRTQGSEPIWARCSGCDELKSEKNAQRGQHAIVGKNPALLLSALVSLAVEISAVSGTFASTIYCLDKVRR
jgi:hypothetical protein